MGALAVAVLVFGLVFGAAFGGIALQARLHDDRRDPQSKDTIQLVMSLVSTMAALVLSLLIAASHTFLETQQEEVQKLSRDVILLDQAFAEYGSEAAPLRVILRQDVLAATKSMSPDEGIGLVRLSEPKTASASSPLFTQVLALDPKSPMQRYLQTKAIDLLARIGATRLLIHEQATNNVPAALVVIMVIWLMLLFAGFGLFARRNETVLVALGLGAFAVASAIFLIIDMSHPYRGLIHVSRTPIDNALDRIGR